MITKLMVLSTCAIGLLFPSWDGAQPAGGVVASQGWAQLPAPSKTEMAIYMLLENHNSQSAAVVSASSEVATRVAMYEMTMAKPMAGDMEMGKGMEEPMNMPISQTEMLSTMIRKPIKQIEIPAGGRVMLEPTGVHMMLFGLKARPRPGDEIKVTLKLQDGTSIPLKAVVLR